MPHVCEGQAVTLGMMVFLVVHVDSSNKESSKQGIFQGPSCRWGRGDRGPERLGELGVLLPGPAGPAEGESTACQIAEA